MWRKAPPCHATTTPSRQRPPQPCWQRRQLASPAYPLCSQACPCRGCTSSWTAGSLSRPPSSNCGLSCTSSARCTACPTLTPAAAARLQMARWLRPLKGAEPSDDSGGFTLGSVPWPWPLTLQRLQRRKARARRRLQRGRQRLLQSPRRRRPLRSRQAALLLPNPKARIVSGRTLTRSKEWWWPSAQPCARASPCWKPEQLATRLWAKQEKSPSWHRRRSSPSSSASSFGGWQSRKCARRRRKLPPKLLRSSRRRSGAGLRGLDFPAQTRLLRRLRRCPRKRCGPCSASWNLTTLERPLEQGMAEKPCVCNCACKMLKCTCCSTTAHQQPWPTSKGRLPSRTRSSRRPLRWNSPTCSCRTTSRKAASFPGSCRWLGLTGRRRWQRRRSPPR